MILGIHDEKVEKCINELSKANQSTKARIPMKEETG